MNAFEIIRYMLDPHLRFGHDLDTPLADAEEQLEVWEPNPGPLFACPHCGETMCCRLAAELQTDHPK